MCLEKVNHFRFKKEYFFGEKILNTQRKGGVSGHLKSRIYGLGLSAFAGINLAFDGIYITRHTLGALKHAIQHKVHPINYCDTRRNYSLTLSELLRHTAGTVGGSFVAVFSPKHAVKWFLPPNQLIIQPRLTKAEATRLYAMTNDMHDLFVENGIPYCMTSGTQLGSTRHGGIMPHDDDVDVFVMESDQEKIESLTEQLNEKGIIVVESPLGYKFCDANGSPVPGSKNGCKFPFIDICLAREENGKITYVNDYFRTSYSGEYVTLDEWNNRTLQPFGSFHLYGTPNPEEFCYRMYGSNVFKYGYTSYNHRLGRNELLTKFYLKKNDNGLCDPIDVS